MDNGPTYKWVRRLDLGPHSIYTKAVEEAPPAELELRPAKLNDRFIAYVMDSIPFFGGYYLSLLFLIPKLGERASSRAFLFQAAAAWALLCVIYQLAGNVTGGTIGKRIMGLRVVGRDGGPLGFGRSFVRALGYLASTPLFNAGFILALVHPESRALHDLLSGSVVVEGRPRSRGEDVINFLGAMCLIISMFGGTLYMTMTRPTPFELQAIERAREGLTILSQIQDAHFKEHGTFAGDLTQLAQASGDVEQFKSAMLEIYDPNLFKVKGGNKAYRITAAARDRKRTRVSVEGKAP